MSLSLPHSVLPFLHLFSAELFSSTATFVVCRALDHQPSCFLFLSSWALWCSSVLDWWHKTTDTLKKENKTLPRKTTCRSHILWTLRWFCYSLFILQIKSQCNSKHKSQKFKLNLNILWLNMNLRSWLNMNVRSWLNMNVRSCTHTHSINTFVFLCKVFMLAIGPHHGV